MPQVAEPKRGGMVIGPPHNADGTPGGGVPFVLEDTGRHIEEEGLEVNIPRELRKSPKIYSFRGTNAQVLDKILKLAGLSLADKVTNVRSGDIVICVRSAWDDQRRVFTGTIEQILHEINTSKGCKPIPSTQSKLMVKNGGALSKGVKPREKDWQALDPYSPRWQKKKESLQQLSNNIHRLRLNVSRDLQSEDERTALTALVVAVMDRSAERIGNDDSADNGHFGVTGFRKKHITVVGSKVHLEYVGKSGTKHDKSISDLRIAKALKKAIKNAPGKFIFETSDGFRIKSDKVNRYLEPFAISAKDLRGYNANKWIIELLKKEESRRENTDVTPEKARKERKKIFNKAVKETAARVGHGAATLKKHYMVPELPVEYIEKGKIIDMKNIGYYKDGGPLGDLKVEDFFANKNEVPDIVNQEAEKIYIEAQDEGVDKIFNSQVVKEVQWNDVVPTQGFLRSSKFERLNDVKDIYSINYPWAIEYNGKYYINDGHHRAVKMHERGLPIKVHAYPMQLDTAATSSALEKGIEVEKEHRELYLEIKKRLAEIGIEMPISEQEFYTEIAKAHIKERKDYYDLLEKYVEQYKNMAKGGYVAPILISVADDAALALLDDGGSVEEKIAKRLQERQRSKEFKDTGVATYTRKYQAAYEIITLADLVDIEKDNVTAYKLIEKSKIWPPYNVNELKAQGNTSGAAYLKVKCREFLSARPLDTKEAREVYVSNIEKLRAALESIKTALDVKQYLETFADLDKMDLGDLSSLPSVSWITSSYTGNLKKYNSRKVEEYFDNIFGKKFYNFCHAKSDSSRVIYAEAFLYESYTQASRDSHVNKRYQISQGELKRYQNLKDKVESSAGTDAVIKQLIKESGIPYYEYKYDKAHVLDFLNKYIAYLNNQTKERIISTLPKSYTVREEDWSWFGAEKKAAAPKDEEGKPRKPQNIFEKYGIEVPKVLKRTPLDFIKRTGALEVGDISTKSVLENYGFKNIIYGNYVNDVESKEHTKHILGAMLDMMELCNIDIKGINKLGGLDINIGSTGCGPFSAASACYFASLKAINLTKKRGDGSLGHEWAHYLDNIIAEGTEKRATNIQWGTSNPAKSERVTLLIAEYKNWLMNGGTERKITVTYYPQKKFLYRIFGETLPESIEAIQKRYPAYKQYKNFDSNDLVRYYGYLAYKMNDNKPLDVELETKATQFYIATSKFSPSDYFLDPQEMFARAFEGWLEYKLGKLGRSSNYLVDIRSGMGLMALVLPRNEWCYPDGSDVIWLDDWFERLFSAIRVDYNINPFEWGTKERVDEYTDYKDTKDAKVDAGVEVKSDGTVIVEGDIEEFEKGYGFRMGSIKDAKGENRNIYRLLTNPYSRGKGFAVGGKQSDVFIFALKYFTNNKSGYGISDGLTKDLPNIVRSMPDAKLEEAKKEAIKYYKNNKESKLTKPMMQESDYQTEMFAEGGTMPAGMPPDPPTWQDIKKFFEGELPEKIPSAKFKTSFQTAGLNEGEAPFDHLNIKPIPYKVRPMDEPLKNLVGTDDLRPNMMGIYYDAEHKQKVATDAHVMAIIKDESITESKIVDPHTGKKIDARYPNYMAVIPVENPNKIHLTGAQVDSLLNELNGIARAKRFLNSNEEYKIVARIKKDDLEVYVNPVMLMIVLKALKQYGATGIDIEISTPNRGILIVDSRKNGNRGLVMPVMYGSNLFYVDVLQNAPAVTAPEPVPARSIEPAPAKPVQRRPEPKKDRKKPNTIHSCAVRLGRKGGLASAKARARMDNGGPIGAESPSGESTKVCGCFHSFLSKEKPELVEKMMETNVNENPALRTEVDEAYQAWQGGDVYAGGGSLDKQWNFNKYGVTTLRDLLSKNVFDGKYKSIENAVKFNRLKDFRMNGPEQQEYYKRVNKKKTVYNLKYTGDDSTSIDVSKEVYDYANLPELPERNYYEEFK